MRLSDKLLLALLLYLVLLPNSVAAVSSWDPALLVNTESFQILDEGDGTSNIEVQFGDLLAKTLAYDRAQGFFHFSDDLSIEGSLSVSGSMSGAQLTVSNLTNCDSIDTTATGQLICGTDNIAILNVASENELVSVEYLTGTTGTSQNAVINFNNGTALSKMFHFCSFSYDVGDDQHVTTFRSTALTSTSQLTIYGGPGTNNNLTYSCQVIIFSTDSVLTVQRGVGESVTATTTSYTLNPTLSSLSRSFVIAHGETELNNDTTIGSEEMFDFRLVGTGTNGLEIEVELQNGGGPNNQLRYEVVDWGNDEIRVQHLINNVMLDTETVDTVTIPIAVDPSKTWLLTTGHATGGGFSEQTARMNARVTLTNSTTVTHEKGATGVGMHWSTQVIEDISSDGIAWTVQSGNVDLASGQNTNSFNLGTPVDTARAFIVGADVKTFAFGGLSNDTSTGNNDTAHITYGFSGSSTIAVTRGVNDSTTLSARIQVVEFAESLSGNIGDFYVSKSGDTMSGDLVISQADLSVSGTVSGSTLLTNGGLKIPYTLHFDVTPVTVTGAGYQTLKSVTIPGGTLATTNAVSLIAWVRRSSGTNNGRYRLQYGGQTIAEMSGGNGNNPVQIEAMLLPNGSTGSQRGYIDHTNSGDTGTATAVATVDSTVNQVLTLQVDLTTDTEQFTCDTVHVTVLK